MCVKGGCMCELGGGGVCVCWMECSQRGEERWLIGEERWLIVEERWLNGTAPDCKSVVLGSNPAPPQHTENSVSP